MSEAAAALFALAGIDKGDVVYLPKRGSYAVICETALYSTPQRLYVKLLKPAIAWRMFERKNRREWHIEGRNLFAWGGQFRVNLDEVQLGQ